MSITLIFKDRERQRYGSGSKGKFISHKETGGMDIFVPSFGTMEQDEVDYVAEGALEKEQARVRHKEVRESKTKEIIQSLTNLALQTKQGQRAKVINKVLRKEV